MKKNGLVGEIMTDDQKKRPQNKTASKRAPKLKPIKQAQKERNEQAPENKTANSNDAKLKLASAERRKGVYPKDKRDKSIEEKRDNRSMNEVKRARLSAQFDKKAQSRDTLAKQRASLEGEVKAMNKMAEVRDTIDSQYTAKFSGFESMISAGPRGATSTGLRKLDPASAIKTARAEIGARIKNKIDPKVQLAISKISKIARDLKVASIKDSKLEVGAKVGADVKNAEEKIVNSKLRSKLKAMKEREIMRDPNRNPSKFEELNMPTRGVGGSTGGMI